MSVVKIKLRSRMSLQTLSSIRYIGYGLKLSGEACYEHQQRFGTSGAYSFESVPSVAEPAMYLTFHCKIKKIKIESTEESSYVVV